MDNNYIKYINYLLSLIFSSLFLVASPYASTTQEINVNKQMLKPTTNIELAYFRVYRLQPGWRYYGYYGPRGYSSPSPGLFRYRVHCQKRCQMNEYGITIRCFNRCY